MSRWYGLGADFCDLRLPHYVAMDRKPENGCELKNSACGSSDIILMIEHVTPAEETTNTLFENETSHGAAVTLRLVEPWFHSDRVVCADSYFASVVSANAPFKKGLRFTGVVKTATKCYLLNYLS